MNMPRERQAVLLSDTRGARIHCQRKAIGLTVGQLAKLLGVSRNTITNYESGKTEPSANDVLRLAEALGCDIMELLPGTPRANVPRFAFRAHSVLRKGVHVIASARKYFRTSTDIQDRPSSVGGSLKSWPLKRVSRQTNSGRLQQRACSRV